MTAPGLALYGVLSRPAFTLGWPLLARRYHEGNRQRRGLLQGLPVGGLWMHAVSVGEVCSAAALAAQMIEHRSQVPQLISTVTETGAVMAHRLAPQATHFYAPWDGPLFVRRAVKALAPKVYAVCETELWPNLLSRLHRESVPLFLLNGRLSDRSFRRYARFKCSTAELLNLFDRVFARSDEDGERFLRLGLAPAKLQVSGEGKLDGLKAKVAEGPALLPGKKGLTFVAGSTHEGEDSQVLEAWRMVRQAGYDARLVLVPRHPHRATDLFSLFRPEEKAVLFSRPIDNWDALVVDRIGLLFSLYGAADGAFVGGSLVPKGCQNLYEPALWGVPFAFGPSFEDFRVPARAFTKCGLGRVVSGSAELGQFWLSVARGEDFSLQRQGARAWFDEQPSAASLWADALQEKI